MLGYKNSKEATIAWWQSLFGRKAPAVAASSESGPSTPPASRSDQPERKGPLTVQHYADTVIHLLETTEASMRTAMLRPILLMMLARTDAEFRQQVYETIKSKSPDHLNSVMQVLQEMRHSA